MDREQSLDPVDVLDTLVNQPATLSVEPTVVLFGDTWHAHNTPNLRLTPQIRHQRSQQSLGIDAVRFGSARSTINLQTCRIDDVVADVMCLEQTVEPEAVVAGLVTRNHFHALLRFFGNARPDPLAKIQELLPITGLQRVATDLVRQRRVDRDNPTLLAQFDCKNTAYGIIMGSSGWQVVHCPGLHQYLLCTGGDLTPWVGSSFPPATPCIGSGKRRLCAAHTQLRRSHACASAPAPTATSASPKSRPGSERDRQSSLALTANLRLRPASVAGRNVQR